MIEGLAGLYFTETETRDDRRLLAQELGYKFIDLELNGAHIKEAQPEVRIYGVEDVDVFADGIRQDGLPNVRGVVGGRQLVFKLDTGRFKWMAGLLDTEYNREWLLSHYNDPKEDWAGDMFKIVDDAVRADIEGRYQKKRDEAIKKIPKLLPDERAEAVKLASRFRLSINKIEKGEKDVDVKPAVKTEEPVIERTEEFVPAQDEKNKQLMEQIKELKAQLKSKKRRRAKRRAPQRRLNADDKTNDNNAGTGGERLEQDGGQGDPAGTG